MSTVVINEQYLTDIANAIRTKNGESTTYKPRELADALSRAVNINNISTDDYLERKSIPSLANNIVTTIGINAFAHYTSLQSVNFPSVTDTDINAFVGCTSLETVLFASLKNVGAQTFKGCTALKNVYMPANNIRFYTAAFSGCILLQKLDFNSVSMIYGETFYNCSALATLIIRSTTQVAGLKHVNAFTGSQIAKGSGYIYVPSNLLNNYKEAQNWKTYANQFRAIEDYPDICG